MKNSEMREIKVSRKNIVGFLFVKDDVKIREMLNIDEVGTFYNVCDKTIEAYENKRITNSAASEIFKLLRSSNDQIRTDKYRFDNNKLFTYSEEQRAYIFERNISSKEFSMKKLGNIYID